MDKHFRNVVIRKAEKEATSLRLELNHTFLNMYEFSPCIMFHIEEEGGHVRNFSGEWMWVPGPGGYVRNFSGEWIWVPGPGKYELNFYGECVWVRERLYNLF